MTNIHYIVGSIYTSRNKYILKEFITYIRRIASGDKYIRVITNLRNEYTIIRQTDRLSQYDRKYIYVLDVENAIETLMKMEKQFAKVNVLVGYRFQLVYAKVIDIGLIRIGDETYYSG